MTWNSDDALEYQRGWRKQNPEKVRGYKKTAQDRRAADKARLDPKTYRQRYFNELHRDRIRAQGFQCELTSDDLEWPDVCPKSGFPLHYGFRRVVLELIDPDGGYVPGNVRFVHANADSLIRLTRRAG